MFLLKLKGWNVTGKDYKSWTEDDLSNYDIIACSDQSRACNLDFNSPVYNAHTEKGIPFIEIADRNSAKAGTVFSYTSKYAGKFGMNPSFLNTSDYITSSLSQILNLVNAKQIGGIDSSLFDNVVKDLIDVTFPKNTISTVFKVTNSPGHGRYAFLGFFSKAGISDLTQNGETVLNNTLHWLKTGDSYFGGHTTTYQKIGKIAFICYNDKCNSKSEKYLIPWLRENGYSVVGKDYKSWTEADLDNFDMMICSNSKACTFDQTSPFYDEHITKGKGFIEIPDTSSIKAGEVFDYVTSGYASSSSIVNLTLNNSSPIKGSLPDILQIFNKRQSVTAIKMTYLNNSIDAAETKSNYSAVFTATGTGRYAFVGFGKYLNYLNDNGNQLLLRVVSWVACGNPNGCS